MRLAPNNDQTLAFAGVFQAAQLAHQLAADDDYDRHALHHAGLSVIRLQADSAESVFESVHALRLGLDCVARLFSGRADASTREVFQYAAGMHQLSVNIGRERRAQAAIAAGLERLRARHAEHAASFDHDDALHEDLGALYERTLSRLRPRIVVRGSEGRLTDPLTVSRVRAALFAGIRAAYLWRQLGGRRWQVVLFRADYHRRAKRLLQRASS